MKVLVSSLLCASPRTSIPLGDREYSLQRFGVHGAYTSLLLLASNRQLTNMNLVRLLLIPSAPRPRPRPRPFPSTFYLKFGVPYPETPRASSKSMRGWLELWKMDGGRMSNERGRCAALHRPRRAAELCVARRAPSIAHQIPHLLIFPPRSSHSIPSLPIHLSTAPPPNVALKTSSRSSGSHRMLLPFTINDESKASTSVRRRRHWHRHPGRLCLVFRSRTASILCQSELSPLQLKLGLGDRSGSA